MRINLVQFAFPAIGSDLLRSLDGSPAVYYADFDGSKLSWTATTNTSKTIETNNTNSKNFSP